MININKKTDVNKKISQLSLFYINSKKLVKKCNLKKQKIKFLATIHRYLIKLIRVKKDLQKKLNTLKPIQNQNKIGALQETQNGIKTYG
jgi:hypothetical protein